MNISVNLNSNALKGLPNLRVLDLSNNEIVLKESDVDFLTHTPRLTEVGSFCGYIQQFCGMLVFSEGKYMHGYYAASIFFCNLWIPQDRYRVGYMC